MTDLKTIQSDRDKLRVRWYKEGFFEAKTISDAIIESKSKWPDAWAVFHTAQSERIVSIREMVEDSLEIAGSLQKLGVGAGDIVAVQLPNWYETVLIYQAVFHLGATLLPIVTIYGIKEVQYILKQSGAKTIIMPSTWRKTNFAERCQYLSDISSLENTIVSGDDVPNGAIPWTDVEAGRTSDFERPNPQPEDLAVLLYTSGTTSSPKGVQHTHNTVLAEINGGSYPNRGTFLNVWPAGHIGGLVYLLRPIILGANQVFMEQWDPELAAHLIQKYEVRECGGTPTFLMTLLQTVESKNLDISSLRRFGLGGAGVSPEQIKITDDRGFPGGRIYGSTEHPTISFSEHDAPFEKRGFTDGKMSNGNEVRIIDETLSDVPIGEEGEIVSRGPELFIGYTDPEINKQSFLPGGWFRTGDIGKLDEDGYLTITDRKKDIIIRGGENISSKEVEDILARHPSIVEAAVTAAPDPVYGEKVCAFVTLKDNEQLTLNDVISHFVEAGAAKQKTPELLEIVEDFPRTASGKIKKFELRKALETNRVPENY